MSLVVRTVLDSEGFEDESGDIAQSMFNYRRLLSRLVPHGQVIWRCAEDRELFVSAVSDLEQAPRKLWLEAMAMVSSMSMEMDDVARVEDCFEQDSLTRAWSDLVDLALVDNARADLLGVPEGEVSVTPADSSLEIGRRSLGADSARFRMIDHLVSHEVPAGSSRNAIWTSLFDAACRASDRVHILDRYAAKEAVESEAGGLEVFLRRLDRCARHVDVTVLTSEAGLSITEMKGRLSAVMSGLPRTNIRELHVSIAPDAEFARASHARHVRFGNRFAIVLDNGLSILKDDQLRTATPVQILGCERPQQRERQALRAAVETLRFS